MFEATCQLNAEISASPDSADAVPRDRDLQRASGTARIVLRGSDGGTEVVDIYQKFPARIMLPMIDDDAVKEAVIVNAAGGIAGGDRLEFDVTALGVPGSPLRRKRPRKSIGPSIDRRAFSQD
jgi:urease accessory protein